MEKMNQSSIINISMEVSTMKSPVQLSYTGKNIFLREGHEGKFNSVRSDTRGREEGVKKG
jgi:hypothetical protein